MAWVAPVVAAAIAAQQQMSGANQRRNASSQAVLDQNKQTAASKMGTYEPSIQKAIGELGQSKTDMNMSEALGSSVKPRDWDPDVPRDDPQLDQPGRPGYGNATAPQKPMSEVLNPYSKPVQQDAAMQNAINQGPQNQQTPQTQQQGPGMASKINTGVGYGQMASGMIQQGQQNRMNQNQAMMAQNRAASANQQYTPTAISMQEMLRARRGY